MEERPEVESTIERLQELLEQRPESGQVAQALMQLYGAGLARIVEILSVAAEPEALDRLAGDRLVGSLLLLHGLHPEDSETRLRKALQRVERGLELHTLVVTGIDDGVARIRVEHNGGGAPPAALSAAIERAVADFAPEILQIQLEGMPKPATALVQIATAPPR